jgi:hypothetical protein
MAANDQKYVKINFEYGTDVDGVLTPKNTGESKWVSLPQESAVLLENHAVIPAFVLMLERAGELGLELTGGTLPTKPNRPPAK